MKYKGIPLLPILTAAAATAVFVTYRSSMCVARERLRGKSTIIPSPYSNSNIEYTEHGAGQTYKGHSLWNPGHAKADRLRSEWQSEHPKTILVAIKAIHTLAWFSIESCMVYLLYAGFAKRSDRRAAVAAVVVGGESLIFALNGFHCPLTRLAESLGAERGSVTDIYLPGWFAHYLPAIHVPLIVLALFLHARNLRQKRKRSKDQMVTRVRDQS